MRYVQTPLLAISLILGLTACAGPTTPFGALNGFGRRIAQEFKAKLTGQGSMAPIIYFTPRRQLLHDRSTFDVVIDDPLGIPSDYKVVLIYNGEDVSSAFLGGAEYEYIDPDHRRLRLTTKNLRLLPNREHNIRLLYDRGEGDEPTVAEFHPPVCPPFEPERKVASIPDFDAPAEYVSLINKAAGPERFNPYYIAGLIAQESGFDPLAISPAKALGLTQVTSLGESEVAKRNSNWPRYPGIEDMSVLELKLRVLDGTINAQNEWRLNPEYSIPGGVEYLSYLTAYWSRADKRAQVEPSKIELGHVLLASYNSGAARVSRAIERNGANWMQDEELNEARAYVRRVTSYCDHFANRGEN